MAGLPESPGGFPPAETPALTSPQLPPPRRIEARPRVGGMSQPALLIGQRPLSITEETCLDATGHPEFPPQREAGSGGGGERWEDAVPNGNQEFRLRSRLADA